MKYVLFIGRWSPFHNGHKYLIDAALKSGHPVCVAIRDTPHSEKDPYPAWLRREMIDAVYENNPNVKIIIIPDIEIVVVGREVGYMIAKVPQEIEDISATNIRAGKSNELPKEVELIIQVWELSKKD